MASHPVLDQLVNRDNPNPYDMPKSAPFILKAPGSQSNNSHTSKHAHKSSSRVEIHKQPVKASTLHPGIFFYRHHPAKTIKKVSSLCLVTHHLSKRVARAELHRKKAPKQLVIIRTSRPSIRMNSVK